LPPGYAHVDSIQGGQTRGVQFRTWREGGHSQERQALLDRVRRHGFIDDYAGIRISAEGRRFRISGATVFELHDKSGIRRGQAAVFAV